MSLCDRASDRSEIVAGMVVDISLGPHANGTVYGLTGTSIFSIAPATYEITAPAGHEGGIQCGSGVHLTRYDW